MMWSMLGEYFGLGSEMQLGKIVMIQFLITKIMDTSSLLKFPGNICSSTYYSELSVQTVQLNCFNHTVCVGLGLHRFLLG